MDKISETIKEENIDFDLVTSLIKESQCTMKFSDLQNILKEFRKAKAFNSNIESVIKKQDRIENLINNLTNVLFFALIDKKSMSGLLLNGLIRIYKFYDLNIDDFKASINEFKLEEENTKKDILENNNLINEYQLIIDDYIENNKKSKRRK